MQQKIKNINIEAVEAQLENHHHIGLFRMAIAAVITMVLASTVTTISHLAFADDRYDDQVQFSEESARLYEEQAESLSEMAGSYEAQLAQLQSQLAQIRAAQKESQQRHDKIAEEIEVVEARLAEHQDILSNILVSIQIGSEISPLEMIASSTTIGEYVDRQAQQTAIRHSLDTEIVAIEEVRKELKEHQEEVEKVIEEQKNQQEQVAAKEREQQKLVDDTRGEEARYRQMAESNNRRVEQLRAEQAEMNRRAAEAAMGSTSSSNVNIPPGILGGDYPFVKGPLDYGVDPWGLYMRQCVSYAAWKVASTGRFVPHFGGRGNANEWASTTARFGIPNGKEPRAGAVAMQNVGVYGQVMYVEKVSDDNTIVVSDYNLAWDGLYRKYTRASGGLTYIYF